MIGGLFALFASRAFSPAAARIAERPEGALGDCFPHVLVEPGFHGLTDSAAARAQKTGKIRSLTGGRA